MTNREINHNLIEDLSRRLRTDDLLNWIEIRATNLARLGWKSPGYVNLGPRLLAEAGIADCVLDTRLPYLASLDRRADGYYVIRHHGFSRVEDHRFWIAHEVAHTLWLMDNDVQKPVSSQQRMLGNDPTIEWLCNRAAAAILVPRGLLEAIVREAGYSILDDQPPIHLLESLARKLKVTPRLLARRWFHDILRVPRNIFCLESTQSKGDKHPSRGQFKILWEAIYSTAPKLHKKLVGRTVPKEAIPEHHSFEIDAYEVDARWLNLVAQARGIIKDSTPFSKMHYRGKVPAQVAQDGSKILISILG